MIEALFGDDERVAAFVASRVPGCEWGFGECVGIGWMDGETMVGGTVYHNWRPAAGVIELSSAADHPRWLTRKSLQTMFEYPFGQLGCQLVVLRVAESNERMRSIARRFGFRETVIPRVRGRHEAECVYTLTEEDWKNRQGKRTEAA